MSKKKIDAILMGVVYHACWDKLENGEEFLDNFANSSYGRALRYLSEKGYVEIESERGRRIIAKITPKGEELLSL